MLIKRVYVHTYLSFNTLKNSWLKDNMKTSPKQWCPNCDEVDGRKPVHFIPTRLPKQYPFLTFEPEQFGKYKAELCFLNYLTCKVHSMQKWRTRWQHFHLRKSTHVSPTPFMRWIGFLRCGLVLLENTPSPYVAALIMDNVFKEIQRKRPMTLTSKLFSNWGFSAPRLVTPIQIISEVNFSLEH